jgi:hypothetical protein
MLFFVRAAARWCSVEPPSPKSCSNTSRGLLCVGNGVVGDAHDSVVPYAQL